MVKKALERSVWEKEEYFASAREHVIINFSKNPGLRKLKDYSAKASKVLDCGCGDGTVIEMIWNPGADFWGVDLSKKAIGLGKKRLKDKRNIHLEVGDLEQIGFPEKSFDLVYAHDVLEHLDNPEKVVKEMIRVTKRGGYLVFLSPNYGSPLHPSPCSPPEGETLMSRTVKQFIKSHFYLVKKPNNLDWMKVAPLCLRAKKCEPDWDTVVEPYLQTLLPFLKENWMKVTESYSIRRTGADRLCSEPANEPGFRQRILWLFKKAALFLGKMEIPPFKYFGPSLFVVARKT